MLGDINGGGMVESLIRRQQEVDENFIQKVVINRNQWPECVGIRRYI